MSTNRNRRSQRNPLRIVFVGIGVLVMAVAGLTVLPREKVDAETAALRREGRILYDANCAACHGFKGEGQTVPLAPDAPLAPPHDETGHTWHHPDWQLIQIVQEGGSQYMPSFNEKLSEDEIRATLAYIKSMWTPDQRVQQESISAQ